jgi:hypothetical protein
MKKLLIFLFYRSLTQREYQFEDPMDAYAFAVQFEGTVEIVNNSYQVTI